MKSTQIIDIVIPVFNESGIIEQTYANICRVIRPLPHKFNMFLVDDGSTDGTPASLAAMEKDDECVTVLTLARNFGHQAALTAGLDASRGDFVINMDGD